VHINVAAQNAVAGHHDCQVGNHHCTWQGKAADTHTHMRLIRQVGVWVCGAEGEGEETLTG
jgi:hypothetical protein